MYIIMKKRKNQRMEKNQKPSKHTLIYSMYIKLVLGKYFIK